MIDAAGGLLAIMLRFVAVTATTGVVGAWVFYRFVLPRLSDAVDADTRESWRVLALRALVVLAGVLGVTAAIRYTLWLPVPPGLTDGERVHLQVFWRSALAVQCGIALLVALHWGVAATWRYFSPRVRDAAVLVLALVPPTLAHAGTATEMRLASYVVDIAHGLAAGGWIGALAFVAIAVRRSQQSSSASAHATALFAAFHPVALIAAPMVFATGLATAWLRMGVPEGIANPTYSGLFVAKLLVAGVTGYFGAGHSKLVTKKGAIIAPAAIQRTLAAEVGFAVVVLVLTALLLSIPPIG